MTSLNTIVPCCFLEGRKGLKIYFDKCNPEDCLKDKSLYEISNIELKNALKKPFEVVMDIGVLIEYQEKNYNFIIPSGFDWNGANVPFFAWQLIGQQKEPRFKLSSCVHDYI